MKSRILLLLFLITNAYANTDEILSEKVKKFEETKDPSEIEGISSDIYFIGNGHLISGDSGKALICFKTAMEMTPKHAVTINKKIAESISVYKEATLKIPKANCNEVKERASFIKHISPDTYHELTSAFPDCLDQNIIKEDLDKKAQSLEIEKQKIVEEKASVEVELKKIDEFNKNKFAFLNLNLPDPKIELEKKAYESLGEEISTVLKNRDFLPDDIISTMQDEALKLIKLESSKVELDYSSIQNEASVIKIPLHFNILRNEIIEDEFIKRYKQLLELKGADTKYEIGREVIKVSPKVSEFIDRNRTLDRNIKYQGENKLFPIFPPYLVIKFEMTFKDVGKNLTLYLPFGLINVKDSFAPLIIRDVRDWNKSLQNIRSGKDRNLTSQVFILEQKMRNELLKEMIDIKASIDKDSTIILNNILQANPITAIDHISNLSFKDENNDIQSGLTIDDKKEGLFYVFRNSKQIGTVFYHNNLPLSAHVETEDKKMTGSTRYCTGTLCHDYIDLKKENKDYKVEFYIGTARCEIGVSKAILKLNNSNRWTGKDGDGQKLRLRFEKDDTESDIVYLNIEDTCIRMLGEHKFQKWSKAPQ